MQLLAKFKIILYMGFRATLNFQNFPLVKLMSFFFSYKVNKVLMDSVFVILFIFFIQELNTGS